jgi:ADP-ribosyl-[dinitrogen reductase] hydrolase
MIGAIAGDIIGSRFEGESSPYARFKLFHPACSFTDDTVCVLAVADALLNRRLFARNLRRFVRRHPDRGYGRLFEEWSQDARAGPYGSWGNGAPMRVAAVGWLASDEAEALDLAAAQASVTHDHQDAISAAQAVAVAILRLRQGQGMAAVKSHITMTFQYDLTPEVTFEDGGFDVSAVGTVPPALTAAFEPNNWEEAVRRAVCLGGDTDTLACIAGAVAEAIHGVPDQIAAKARGYLTPDLARVLFEFERKIGRMQRRDRAPC